MTEAEASKIREGDKLLYKPTGEIITVKCSCPSTQPRYLAKANVKRNYNDYELPSGLDK